MALIDVDWNPPNRQLRQFAGVFLPFFLCLALFLHLKHDTRLLICGILGGMAVVVGVAGLIRPRLIRPVYVAMMALALPIGMVVSVVLLAAIYYLLLTPIGLGLRLSGRDPMGSRPAPDAKTFWKRRNPPKDVERYFRQY
jgi:hypothetical protein